VTTAPDGRLHGRGQIFAVNGTYFAFGQRLDIQRGRLIFDGPLDNPALDIVALRRNQAVEAGVAVTGTVRVPVITLTSNPSVPDSEKLAWLILGRSADSGSGADAAALQVASVALLSGRGGKPLTTRIAQSLGLDDIAFGSSAGSQAAGGTNAGTNAGAFDNQVIMFGKRLSDRLSIVYQQGLTVANNALRLEYALTRTLTVRAEAGVVSSIGIAYRRTFD
jgi:translocation and assembly module TamB